MSIPMCAPNDKCQVESSSTDSRSYRRLLAADGKLIVEFGHGQLEQVKQLFREEAQELRFIRASTDCNQLQRCVVYAVK